MTAKKMPRVPGGDRSEARNNDAEIVQFITSLVNWPQYRVLCRFPRLLRRLRRIRGGVYWEVTQ
jgi:hypothetical protein